MVQILSNAFDYAPVSTILVVEDEVMIRMAVAEDLRACGFEVREAASAPAAIEVLEQDAEVDAVFSDVHMPGHLNGLDLARWILVHKPQVKVVLTSAAFESSNLPDELRQTVCMIPKPYEYSAVLRQFRLSGISACETDWPIEAGDLWLMVVLPQLDESSFSLRLAQRCFDVSLPSC